MPNEKLKSFNKINYIVEKCNGINLNRNDLIIALVEGSSVILQLLQQV